jgi:hypothetical protein
VQVACLELTTLRSRSWYRRRGLPLIDRSPSHSIRRFVGVQVFLLYAVHSNKGPIVHHDLSLAAMLMNCLTVFKLGYQNVDLISPVHCRTQPPLEKSQPTATTPVPLTPVTSHYGQVKMVIVNAETTLIIARLIILDRSARNLRLNSLKVLKTGVSSMRFVFAMPCDRYLSIWQYASVC